MNNISFRLVSFLLGLVALTVVSNTRSACAETPNTELSVELSEPAAAENREVASTVTTVTTSEPLENHSTLSVAPSKLAAAVREVAPTVTTVTTSELLENHSTVSLEPPKPAKVSLREIEPTKTLLATTESLENHSTVSMELPKLATAPVQAVEPTAAPVAANDEPRENHSSVSVELPKLATAPVQAVEPSATPVTPVEPLAANSTFTKIPEDMTGKAHVQQAYVANTNKNQPDSQKLQLEVSKNDQQVSSKAVDTAPVAKPIPGTLATSAALLTAPLQTSPQPQASSNPADSTVAQTEIQPGQATRGGRSYIGIGGNLGFGDTGLGSGAFVINSKIGLTNFLSVRPSILIGDDVNFLIPVTYDFTIESDDPFAPVPFAPFAGGGVVISTAEDNNIGFLLTGGVDVPLSREFVANATLNIGFMEDSTDVGLTVGVGYTFPNFIR